MFTYAVKSKDPRNKFTEANDGTLIGDLVTAEYVTLHREDMKITIYKDALGGRVTKDNQFLAVMGTAAARVHPDMTVYGALRKLRDVEFSQKRPAGGR